MQAQFSVYTGNNARSPTMAQQRAIRVAHVDLASAATITQLDPVEIQAAIEADGWCGALDGNARRVVIIAYGDPMPGPAIDHLAGCA